MPLGYDLVQLDLGRDFPEVLEQIGTLFHWSEEFGYDLEDHAGNLDAIRDGFDFHVPAGRTGIVLELVNVESLWKADRDWTAGLLSIACEHSRYQLALGCRFFTLLVLPSGSPVIGATVDEVVVPFPSSIP
jgi:hypothetical protein